MQINLIDYSATRWMKDVDFPALNYLHYGDSIDKLTSHCSRGASYRTEIARRGAKETDVYRYLQEQGLASRSDVESILSMTVRWRKIFRHLRCRGFSFSMEPISLPHPGLRLDMQLVLGLIAHPDHYYPPAVRDGMLLLRKHERHSRAPRATCWLLGQAFSAGRGKCWVVLNLQSDWMSFGASSVRVHFRGWQRVILYCLLEMANLLDVAFVAMPPAAAVARASFPLSPERKPSRYWTELYDGTALALGMRLCELDEAIDIQPMAHFPPVMCSTFYVKILKTEVAW